MIRYMRDYLIICSEKLLQNLSILLLLLLLLLDEPQSVYPSCQAEFSATLTIISLMPFLPPFSFLLFGCGSLVSRQTSFDAFYYCWDVPMYPIDRWIRYMKLINTRFDDKTRQDNMISLPSSNF